MVVLNQIMNIKEMGVMVQDNVKQENIMVFVKCMRVLETELFNYGWIT